VKAVVSIFIAAVLGIFISMGAAHAADMAVKAPSLPPPAPVSNWAGWYVGLNAGGDWGTADPSTTVAQSGFFAVCAACVSAIGNGGRQTLHTDGFTGGGQAGYNWQAGSWVVGLEADFEYFRSQGSSTATFMVLPGIGGGTATINSALTTDWLFTARPRLGFVVSDNYLFYGTGGLAVSELKGNWNYTDNLAGGIGTESASSSQVKAGWTAGGGVEAKLQGNWVFGVEYLYVKFDNISTSSTNYVTSVAALSAPFTHGVDLAANIVRLRLSEKF
jgi:outer membrane immunogenic protein